MRPFTDSRQRKWEIAINVATIKRVRALTGKDLLAIADGDLLQTLVGDPVLLADILWVLVQPQAQAQGVSDEDFGSALAGDAIEAATAAFLEELVDFFPQSRRQLLQRALKALRDLEAVILREADQKLEEAIQTLGGSSGSSPALSASIPAG
ncbi:MAG: hypothetical protein AB7F75_01250 [Planctomycetota bacterium]